MLIFLSLFFLFSKTTPFPVTEEKPLVIVIPSYNNERFVEKNLRSVFSQNYTNYRVLYINDNSTDSTSAKVEALLAQIDRKNRTKLIQNASNRGALANIYNAVHSCKDEEIIVILDGDDALAHENVLKIVNQTYADPDVWLTYGNYLDYPSYTQGVVTCKEVPAAVLKKRQIRKAPWMTHHLRTFYAALYKQIKLEDLVYRSRFFSMAGDLAIMFPMIDMAGLHARFIPDILYLYNRENPLSDHKINFAFQEECAQVLRNKTPYPSLEKLPHSIKEKGGADLVIFSKDHPLELFALLESINQYVKGVEKVSIFYQASHIDQERSYLTLKTLFPHHFFTPFTEDNFQLLLVKIIREGSPYLLFAHDNLLVNDTIDLREGIEALERTRAYGLFYPLHRMLTFSSKEQRFQTIPPFGTLADGLNCWQFSFGGADWAEAHRIDLVLYPKEAIKGPLSSLSYSSPSTLIATWKKAPPSHDLGLFYEKAKCLELSPTNLSQEEGLKKFLLGLKIDLKPFHKMENLSMETNSPVSFIKR